MSFPSKDEQRFLVRQWEETGRELERLRLEALRNKPYSFEEVDALLQLAEGYDGPPRYAEGMVEMQRIFMKSAPGQPGPQVPP